MTTGFSTIPSTYHSLLLSWNPPWMGCFKMPILRTSMSSYNGSNRTLLKWNICKCIGLQHVSLNGTLFSTWYKTLLSTANSSSITSSSRTNDENIFLCVRSGWKTANELCCVRANLSIARRTWHYTSLHHPASIERWQTLMSFHVRIKTLEIRNSTSGKNTTITRIPGTKCEPADFAPFRIGRGDHGEASPESNAVCRL